MPAVLHRSSLNTPDADAFAGEMVPGAPCADAPIRLAGRAEWLLGQLGGTFNGLYFAGPQASLPAVVAKGIAALDQDSIPVRTLMVAAPGIARTPDAPLWIEDADGLVAQRYDARPGTFYLLRPDQHVCARWRDFRVADVRAAVARATCND